MPEAENTSPPITVVLQLTIKINQLDCLSRGYSGWKTGATLLRKTPLLREAARTACGSFQG